MMDKGVEALVAFLEKADEGLAARWVPPARCSVANRLPGGERNSGASSAGTTIGWADHIRLQSVPPRTTARCMPCRQGRLSCRPCLIAAPPRLPTTARCSIAGPAAAVLAGKCLKGKPGTVAKAGEACLLLVELEQQAPVVEAVLKAFSDKVPKVVLAAVDILLQAVRCVPPALHWVLACAACRRGAYVAGLPHVHVLVRLGAPGGMPAAAPCLHPHVDSRRFCPAALPVLQRVWR